MSLPGLFHVCDSEPSFHVVPVRCRAWTYRRKLCLSGREPPGVVPDRKRSWLPPHPQTACPYSRGGSHRTGDLAGHQSVTPIPGIPVQPLGELHSTSRLFRSASAPKLFPVGRHGCPTQGGDCDRRDQTPSPSEIAAAASGEGGAGNPASATQRVCVTGVWREPALEKLAAHGGSHGPTSSETRCANDTVQVIRSFLQWLRDISS